MAGSRLKRGFRAKRIILFSDDSRVARAIEKAMNMAQLNHEVVLADSPAGSEADAAAGDTPFFDLCILAYPGNLDRTLDALRKLRQSDCYRTIPSVVFVDRGYLEFADMLYREGANSILRYPLLTESLYELMRVMDRYWFGVVTLPGDVPDDGA